MGALEFGRQLSRVEVLPNVGKPLFDQVEQIGANKPVICDSETCRWQITHATGAKSVHPVHVLAAAYGLMEL